VSCETTAQVIWLKFNVSSTEIKIFGDKQPTELYVPLLGTSTRMIDMSTQSSQIDLLEEKDRSQYPIGRVQWYLK